MCNFLRTFWQSPVFLGLLRVDRLGEYADAFESAVGLWQWRAINPILKLVFPPEGDILLDAPVLLQPFYESLLFGRNSRPLGPLGLTYFVGMRGRSI